MINNKIANWNLYILKLEDDKFYVGVTSKTPEIRMQEHMRGVRAAKWTQRYKPIKIFDQRVLGEMLYDEAVKYETKVTKRYMRKYGFNNVRGGDLTDESDYVKRFHHLYLKDDWEVITVVVMLLLIILLLFIERLNCSC